MQKGYYTTSRFSACLEKTGKPWLIEYMLKSRLVNSLRFLIKFGTYQKLGRFSVS